MHVHVVPASFSIPCQIYAPVGRGAVSASRVNRMQMPTNYLTPNYFDPLQSKEESIGREIGNLNTNLKQKKSQLQSQCDKEIEELVAKVKGKYDKMIDEAEASFTVRMKELVTIGNNVVKNMMLAQAFQSSCSYCTDYQAPTGMPQLGNSSNSVEIALQLHSTRRFSPTTSPSIGPLSATPPLPAVCPFVALSAQARLSHVDPVALMAGPHQQIRCEACAPAPHIHQQICSVGASNCKGKMPRFEAD